MVEPTLTLIFELLQKVQKEIADLRTDVAAINRKSGVLAEAMHTMQQDLRAIRNNQELTALTVDELGHRVAALETPQSPHHS